MPANVVAVLGVGLVPPESAVIAASDAGVLRGDGAFEAMHLRPGGPWLLDQHIDRFVTSADRLDLAIPSRSQLYSLIGQVCDTWPESREASVRLVTTRGAEDGSSPGVTFASIFDIPAAAVRQRREGAAVVTAVAPLVGRDTAPWWLHGVKSLSYAVNTAALRWARRNGADDVLWTTPHGFAAEAPTSTLVWRDGDALCTVPAEQAGILRGTTARFLLDNAHVLGLRAMERMLPVRELTGLDGAWLVSSVRGVVAIRTLDGVPLEAGPMTKRLQDLAGFPVRAEEPAASMARERSVAGRAETSTDPCSRGSWTASMGVARIVP